MSENSSPLVQLVLLFAVGIVVLMNFFELRKLRYSLDDRMDGNRVRVQALSSKIEAVKANLDGLQQKLTPEPTETAQ